LSAPRINAKRVDPDSDERQRILLGDMPVWARKSPQPSAIGSHDLVIKNTRAEACSAKWS
jgi:hypothetical protein